PVKLIDPDGRSVEESSCPNPPCNGGYGDNGYLGPGRDDVNISIDYSEGVYSTKSDNSSSKDNSSSSDWAKDQINRLEPEPYDALEIYHEDGVGSRGSYKPKGENSTPVDAITESIGGGMAPSRAIRWLQGDALFMEFIAEVVDYFGFNTNGSNKVETSKTDLNKNENQKVNVPYIGGYRTFNNGK